MGAQCCAREKDGHDIECLPPKTFHHENNDIDKIDEGAAHHSENKQKFNSALPIDNEYKNSHEEDIHKSFGHEPEEQKVQFTITPMVENGHEINESSMHKENEKNAPHQNLDNSIHSNHQTKKLDESDYHEKIEHNENYRETEESNDGPSHEIAKPVEEFWVYKNPRVEKSLKEKGKYQLPHETEHQGCIQLGPHKFEKSGVIYEGQWKNKSRCGKGQQIWPDGSFYDGIWENNMAHGNGRLIHSDGDIYEGEWKNDKANGKGHYYHVDGATYYGEWINDKQHGIGSEVWPDGAKYEGNYSNGKKSGHGVFRWGDMSIYEGEFQNNNIQGKGKYKWNDGRVYEGDWERNKMHGNGIFIWPDGRKYVGGYVDDKKSGYGEFLWPDGRSYKGYWSKGRQHGKAEFCENNSKKYGVWVNGNRERYITKEEFDQINDQVCYK